MKLSKSVKEKLVKGKYNVVYGDTVYSTPLRLMADHIRGEWGWSFGKSIIVTWNGKEWVEEA